MEKMHKDEIPINIELVRKLVDSQFPDFANLPLHSLSASGSSNIQFRLGDELLVRLPRQPGGSAAIEKEERWTPIIGSHLPVAVPDFVGIGEPALGYSERWAIVRWLDGEHPKVCNPTKPPSEKRLQLADELARVILALRSIDVGQETTTEYQLRNYRGGALVDYDEQMHRNIAQCRAIDDLNLDLDAVLSIWTSALDLPGASEVEREQWYHGDLVAENLLLTEGHLTAVLDFGGLGVGDPTIDLHGAWELLDSPAREAFRVKVGVSDAEWLRGRAWALAVATMTFPYYWDTMPSRIKSRLSMAQSVLADADVVNN